MPHITYSSDSELPTSNQSGAHMPLTSLSSSRNFSGLEAQASEEMLRVDFLDRVRQQTDRLREMLESGQLERLDPGIFRAGLEIESFLLHRNSGLAADSCNALLQKIREAGDTSEAWTSEMAEKMIEHRTEPFLLRGKALSYLEGNIISSNRDIDGLAEMLGIQVLSSGTLPTEMHDNLTLDHLSFNETARKRYERCNEFANTSREGSFSISVGSKEKQVSFELDSLMAAGSICSIQPHLQCDPADFVTLFNLSIALAAHTMAPSVGSPLVLGRQADAESRISLLEQSWEKGRVYLPAYITRASEPFEENCYKHKPVFYDVNSSGKNSSALPELEIQNGTVHRWVRPIYGVTDGVPHLRIEFRPLSAYPAALDNVANSAWYWGLVQGMKLHMDDKGISDVRQLIPEQESKQGFRDVASRGLDALIYDPLTQRQAPASEVTLGLARVAREGLVSMGLDAQDVDRYLDIIRGRAESGKTLSQWIVERQRNLASGDNISSTSNLSVNQTIALELAESRRRNVPIHLFC